MKNIIYISAIIVFTFTSCNKNDDGDTINVINVEAPATYSFTRNNESTVSFSGQTTRILMAEETVSAFLDFDNATEASISAMFAHVEGANDFSDTALNASNKSVRSKVAASKDYFDSNTTEAAQLKAIFDNYITIQATQVSPNSSTLASPGVAGQIADGSSTRYIAANGLEYNQAFAKGLIGALMTDQILNNYLSPAVLDAENNVENNDNDVLDGDKPYTTMEHKWDEAYGYLFGTAANTTNPIPAVGEADNFLNKYLGRVEGDTDFAGIAQNIFDAFKLGRAAIVAKNYDVRDVQAAFIQENISKIIAIRAIYYLQNGKLAIENEDFGGAFHDLSEGYGFITSLRFTKSSQTNESYFSSVAVDGFIDDLMTDGPNGLWNVTPATLDSISEMIASKFSFTVAEAASVN